MAEVWACCVLLVCVNVILDIRVHLGASRLGSVCGMGERLERNDVVVHQFGSADHAFPVLFSPQHNVLGVVWVIGGVCGCHCADQHCRIPLGVENIWIDHDSSVFAVLLCIGFDDWRFVVLFSPVWSRLGDCDWQGEYDGLGIVGRDSRLELRQVWDFLLCVYLTFVCKSEHAKLCWNRGLGVWRIRLHGVNRWRSEKLRDVSFLNLNARVQIKGGKRTFFLGLLICMPLLLLNYTFPLVVSFPLNPNVTQVCSSCCWVCFLKTRNSGGCRIQLWI
jgi:hypothetical protein